MISNLNSSQVKIIPALSAVALAAAGSSNAVDLSGFTGGMLIVSHGSTPATTGLAVNLLRSGTSDGTFAGWGASLPAVKTNGQVATRSFAINTSAVWHKISYDGNNGGSHITAVTILAYNGRNEPVPSQHTSVTGYSDVLSG
jgi:hypothetical protein